MDSQEFIPSLRIRRRVIGLPDDFGWRMAREVSLTPEIARSDVHLQLRQGTILDLVRPSEFQTLFEYTGQEPSPEAIGDLAKRVESHFPPKFRKPLRIDLKPLDSTEHIYDGNKFNRPGEKVDFFGFQSPHSETLNKQIYLARQIVARCLELDPNDPETKALWNNRFKGRLLVAGVLGVDNYIGMKRLYARSKVFPTTVLLGAVECRPKLQKNNLPVVATREKR